MGFFKKISQPERTSTFYVQRIWLTDTTGEVILGLSAKYKYMVRCVDNRDVNFLSLNIFFFLELVIIT